MAKARSALVIGGGIIGTTSAFALAQDGWLVRIVDARQGIAEGASWGNGRQLSYSHTNALASTRMLAQIPRLLLGYDDAFRLKPKTDIGFARWVLEFLTNCTSTAYRRNTLETLQLAAQSRAAMARTLARYPIDFDHAQAGKLVLLHNETEMRSARWSMNMKREAGLNQELLTPTEACVVEPALEHSKEAFVGALYSPADATGDCHAFALGLFETGQREFGMQFRGQSGVKSVARHEGGLIATLEDGEELRSDLVVLANGHELNSLLRPLGHWLPVTPMKGYSFTAPLGNAAPRVSVTDQKRRIVFTNLGDRMLVAGIAELGRLNNGVDQARLGQIINAARMSLPEAAIYDAADSGWAGLRPMTPNSQPITRMLEPGIAVNAGHGMLGWTLAMGSAERLRSIVKANA